MEDAPHTLQSIEADLVQAKASPPGDWPSFLASLLKRFRRADGGAELGRKADLLVEIAAQYYIDGTRTIDAIAPISLAVALLRQADDRGRLRRALSIQGLVLSSSNHALAALSSLEEAIDVARALGETISEAAGWTNVAVCFMKATMWSDATSAAKIAIGLATAAQHERTPYVLAIAHHGLAVCFQNLRSYNAAIVAAQTSLDFAKGSSAADLQVSNAFCEALLCILSIRTGRHEQAREHAAKACEFAIRCGAARVIEYVRVALAELDSHADQCQRAIETLESMRRRPMIDASTRRTLLDVLSDIYVRQGRPEKALEVHREQLRSAATDVASGIAARSALQATLNSIEVTDAGANLRALARQSGAARAKHRQVLLSV